MGISVGQAAYALAFQKSPIVLTNGIATNIPGGMLPIISIIQAIDFSFGLLSGGNIGQNGYFANFQPLPGGTLIKQRAGTYPYANQSVAANAVIADPLTISLLMLAPASAAGGYLTKLGVMTSLQATLAQHNGMGGTYIVATGSFFYTNCLLMELRDISPALSKQAQIGWQWDFYKPLLTLADAQAAQNSLLSKISSGATLQGQDPSDWNVQSTTGTPSSLATSSVAPAATNTPGTITASPSYAGSPV
ncbi:MAG TPA: hypothetical protein VMV19_17595 [Xanthobacteraceae bacterium]|nr:hypothetical protein [Xanthobacteraceae bacterium]